MYNYVKKTTSWCICLHRAIFHFSLLGLDLPPHQPFFQIKIGLVSTQKNCETIKGKTEIINTTSARYRPTPLPAWGALVRGCLSVSTDGRIFQTTVSPQTFQTISRVLRQMSKSWQSSSHQGRLGEMAAAPALVVAPFYGKYPFMSSMPGKYDKNPH